MHNSRRFCERNRRRGKPHLARVALVDDHKRLVQLLGRKHLAQLRDGATGDAHVPRQPGTYQVRPYDRGFDSTSLTQLRE